MTGNRQLISIGSGCEQKGIVQHEILHALGRIHEQSRLDRDQYVAIHLGTVPPGIAELPTMYIHVNYVMSPSESNLTALLQQTITLLTSS